MLATGDAAPDITEIFASLHFRGRRRMVGTDRADIAEPVAERLSFVVRAKWRRALGESTQLFHVLVCEDEVMRTGLTSHIDSFGPSPCDEVNAASAAHMNNVKPAAGFPGGVDRATDR